MGNWVALSQDDLVEASLLKDFIYEQDQDSCAFDNQGKCDDDFSYIPYGEWIGMGEYQATQIKINPVMRQDSVVETSITETTQLKKETAVVNNAAPTCQDNTPIMVALVIVSITLLIPAGVLASKIKNLNAEKPAAVIEFESTQSKAALKLAMAESAEESLKKAEVPKVDQ